MKNVLVGTVEIAGFFGNLSTGLRQNGYRVTEVYFSEHLFNYSNNQGKTPWLFKIARTFRTKFYSKPQSEIFPRLFFYFIYQASLHLFFIQALATYQVFVFGFGLSILEKDKDLKWLKRFGKTVISNVAMGSEARPPFIDGARRNSDGSFLPAKDLIDLSRVMKAKLEGIEKYSTFVIGAPLTSQFLEKPFINLFDLGLPYPKSKAPISHSTEKNVGSKIKILHSPSHPYAKGTFLIRKAISSLKGKGYDIEYNELTNKPNSMVLEAISNCDFVVDQVFSDTAMATFATEAAFFGKPAVVGGYGWEVLRKFIKKENFPVTEICSPNQLELTIENLIKNPERRIEIGKKANQFANANWEAKIVGKKFSQLIEGNVPEDWFLDPQEIVYTNGVGIEQSDVKKVILNVIKVGGVQALCMENKPRLKKEFLHFCHINESEVTVETSF